MVTLDERAWMRAWGRNPEDGSEKAGQPAPPESVVGGVAEDSYATTVTCGFCGHEFVEDPTQATCQACPLKKNCGLMRCPQCGFENPKQPAWIARLKEWIG